MKIPWRVLTFILALFFLAGCGRVLSDVQVQKWCRTNCGLVRYADVPHETTEVLIRVNGQLTAQFGLPIPPRRGYNLEFCRIEQGAASREMDCRRFSPKGGESTVARVDVPPGDWLVKLIPQEK